MKVVGPADVVSGEVAPPARPSEFLPEQERRNVQGNLNNFNRYSWAVAL